MKLFTVAIGEQYENEAARLQRTIPSVEIFTISNPQYTQVNDDPLINGLWHKCNFANYISDTNEEIIFLDADAFTFKDNPFATFSVEPTTDFAYVPYTGTWWLPDEIRQNAFNYHGHKINSGVMYFRNLEVAQTICNQWQYEYLEREKLYDLALGTSKYEYDEWALMIALSKLNYNLETLDKKWNDWELNTEGDINNSDSILFQSHHLFLDL